MKNKTKIQQNFTLYNKDVIKDFFQKGCKSLEEYKIGVEVEHFIVRDNTRRECYNNTYECMSAAYEQVVLILHAYLNSTKDKFITQEELGKLIGFYNNDYSISLEPASQIEISIFPQRSLSDIERIYTEFKNTIDPILEEQGFKLVTKGYNPYDSVKDLKLIPKKRYEYMNRYFEKSGKYGKNMMRATASTQVSIDYEDEKDCSEKFRLACILSPVFSLITDNVDVFEGKPYEKHLARTMIWNSVDDDRCKVVDIPLYDDNIFETYADKIYSLPAIVMVDGEEIIEVHGIPVSEYYVDRKIDEDIVKHLISMAFFDVRLKNYVEIRMADSMELPQVLAYTAIIKSIFYNKSTVKELLDYFGEISLQNIADTKLSLIDNGSDGFIYERPARDVVKKVFMAAYQGMNEEERDYYDKGKHVFQNR